MKKKKRFNLMVWRERPLVWWLRPFWALFLFLALGYLLGFVHGYGFRARLIHPGSGLDFASQAEFDLFWTIADLVKERYYGPLATRELVYGSIEGLVNALGDPYTSFALPGKGRQFLQELAGNYEGVGLELEYRGEDLVVIAPLKGSSAEKAGLKAGDIVLAIDGEKVPDRDILEAIGRIRGPIGSKVGLLVEREGELLNFELTRQLVHLKSVNLQEEEGIAVLTITKFIDDTEKLFNKAVGEILKTPGRGIVLDLRNNPGGLLDAAVKVANEFLPAGKLIVEERFKDGRASSFTADGSGRLAAIKTVVLINAGTASAAEIVAGALQAHGRAVLAGERSYGKGSVQEVDEFADGSILKLTIAAWFTPRGESLAKGLKPDLVMKDDSGEGLIQKAKELLLTG